MNMNIGSLITNVQPVTVCTAYAFSSFFTYICVYVFMYIQDPSKQRCVKGQTVACMYRKTERKKENGERTKSRVHSIEELHQSAAADDREKEEEEDVEG